MLIVRFRAGDATRDGALGTPAGADRLLRGDRVRVEGVSSLKNPVVKL